MSLEAAKTKVRFTVDTAFTINLMKETTFKSLSIPQKLEKSNTRAYAYGNNVAINIIGQFFTRTRYNNGEYKKIKIHVVGADYGNIIGFKTLTELNIIHIVQALVNKSDDDEFKRGLVAKYPSLFSNKIGKLKNHSVKLHINTDIKPVRQKSRTTAIHLRPGV